MEHRWGQRIRSNITARIGAQSGTRHLARLTDLSMSGAFLRISLPVDEMHPICVQIPTPGRRRGGTLIEAYVVRRTRQGVGIEWTEMGHTAVLTLLAALRPEPAAAMPPETVRTAEQRTSVHRHGSV